MTSQNDLVRWFASFMPHRTIDGHNPEWHVVPMPTQLEKCQRLADLHNGPDPFIIPNPWDAGSAKLLQSLGFQALATTSSGFAVTLAEADGLPSLDQKLAHCQFLASVTEVPVSVDF